MHSMEWQLSPPPLSLAPQLRTLFPKEAHLVAEVVKNPTANTAHFYIMDMMPEVWTNPDCDEDANHLLAHNPQELIVSTRWRKHSTSWRNWRCKWRRLFVIFDCGTSRPLYRCWIFSWVQMWCFILQTTHILLRSQAVDLSLFMMKNSRIWQMVFRRQESRELIFFIPHCFQ